MARFSTLTSGFHAVVPVRLAFAAMILCLALSACGSRNSTKQVLTSYADPIFKTFVSFAPSTTELIYTIHGQDGLLGVCSQCDFPAVVSEKPRVGTFTSVNLEKLVLLHPDGAFLVQGQEAIAAKLRDHGILTVLLRNSTVDDVSDNLRRIGRIIHDSAGATASAADFDKQVGAIRNAVARLTERPKVLFLVWGNPMVAVGSKSYLDEAITICGGLNTTSKLSGDYPLYSTERLVLDEPDVIILPHEDDTPGFLSRAPWTSLKAVQAHRVYFLPEKSQDHLSRPTTRLVAGLRWLAERLHPGIHFGS